MSIMKFYEAYPLPADAIDYSKYEQVDSLYSLGKGRDLIEKSYNRRVFFVDETDMRVHEFLQDEQVPTLRLEKLSAKLGQLIIPEGAYRYDSLLQGKYDDKSLADLVTPLGRALRRMYDSTRLVPRTSVLSSFLCWPEVNNDGMGVAVCPPYDLAFEPNPRFVASRYAEQLMEETGNENITSVMLDGILEGWEYVG